MARVGRPGMNDAQKKELWERWRRGESLSDIGRALGKFPASVFCVLRLHGGYSPPARTRSTRALSLAEREEISRGLTRGHSLRQIAATIGRAPSTVCREVNRNGGRVRYRAHDADQISWDRARRPRLCRLALNGRLRRIVATKLALEWSPEQISGWLKRTYPKDEALRVSHETIYRSLFVQSRGVLNAELRKHLRTKRPFRQSRKYNTRGLTRGVIDGIPIAHRPPDIEDRAVPGHWEGDLISGSANTHIATLVERHSRFTLLVKVDGKDTKTVVAALSKQVRKLPAELRRSLTWDRGMELADHKMFTIATKAKRKLPRQADS